MRTYLRYVDPSEVKGYETYRNALRKYYKKLEYIYVWDSIYLSDYQALDAYWKTAEVARLRLMDNGYIVPRGSFEVHQYVSDTVSVTIIPEDIGAKRFDLVAIVENYRQRAKRVNRNKTVKVNKPGRCRNAGDWNDYMKAKVVQ